MKKLKIVETLVVAGLLALFAQASLAAISAEEAKQLGTILTEFGSEKAGNSDGSIPPYTGGIGKVPAYDPKRSRNYIDPFAKEKPLYSVSAKNLAQYEAMLTEGTKDLMRSFADYRIDVYPTHRSMRYPPEVIQNTIKNATTARLGGEIKGDAVLGADKGNMPFPGIPFPIPKDGYEVMWNYKMRYTPAVTESMSNGWMVDAAGRVAELAGCDCQVLAPWYDTEDKLRGQTFDAIHVINALLTSPPSSAGIDFLNMYLPTGQQKVWFYTPGQRRVRMAPEFAYDVPVTSYGGVILWDDTYGFTGRMDRFDFKLLGKKEMLIPYNVFGPSQNLEKKDYLGPKFVKPETVRFEKHRVWVVDAVRKPTARHVCSRRTYYIDEDSWAIHAAESYDNGGKIWRVFHYFNFPTYDLGGTNNYSSVVYERAMGAYLIINVTGEKGGSTRSHGSAKGLQIRLTPQSMAASGVR